MTRRDEGVIFLLTMPKMRVLIVSFGKQDRSCLKKSLSHPKKKICIYIYIYIYHSLIADSNSLCQTYTAINIIFPRVSADLVSGARLFSDDALIFHNQHF